MNDSYQQRQSDSPAADTANDENAKETLKKYL